jgi:putative aminopeptidase FrvX
MMNLEETIIRLSNAFGPSGFEMEARKELAAMLREVAELTYDGLGNVLATHSGCTAKPRILLASHLDEVGLMVRDILPGGSLKAVPLGGWWAPALLAQPVLIRSKQGNHLGVIGAKPPHYMKEEEKNRCLSIADLYIDVGAKDKAEVRSLGIDIGDPVVPAVQTVALSPRKTLMGKAFDDRAGCAAAVQCLRELNHDHPNEVIVAGTVQEEVGLKGARTLASQIRPDLCLVLEGAPADDFPDAGPIMQGKLAEGPQLRRYDPSMIANQHLVDLAIEVAQNIGIPYQVAVREGGATDGSAIQVQTPGGAPAMVIGVPVRYAHSHHGIIHLDDLENLVKLVKALIFRLDATTVQQIRQNPWGRR